MMEASPNDSQGIFQKKIGSWKLTFEYLNKNGSWGRASAFTGQGSSKQVKGGCRYPEVIDEEKCYGFFYTFFFDFV